MTPSLLASVHGVVDWLRTGTAPPGLFADNLDLDEPISDRRNAVATALDDIATVRLLDATALDGSKARAHAATDSGRLTIEIDLAPIGGIESLTLDVPSA
jgi:hypothetical protein